MGCGASDTTMKQDRYLEDENEVKRKKTPPYASSGTVSASSSFSSDSVENEKRKIEMAKSRHGSVIRVIGAKIFSTVKQSKTLNPYVVITAGWHTQKTRHISNSMAPVWNENLFFESFTYQDAQNATVQVLDNCCSGPPCTIGSTTADLQNGLTKRLTIPIFLDNYEKGNVELEVVVLRGTTSEAAVAEKVAADEAAREEREKAKARVEKVIAAEKAAAEKAAAEKNSSRENSSTEKSRRE